MAQEYPFTWPGVPGGPIRFSFPVTALIVPAWRTYQRPGLKAGRPRLPIQHENGNPNAYAAQDSRYLYNGAEGRQASWHGTVDHMEGFANLPGDEVGWQASDGAGPGNMRGFAVELSQRSLKYGTAAEKRQARLHAAEMMGRVMARLDGQLPSKKHQDFAPDRKRCPEYFINEPAAWNQYVDDVHRFYNDEKARMSGKPIEAAFRTGDRLEVIADAVNVRTGYGTAYRIVGTMTKGRTMTVIADDVGNSTQWANGYLWVNVRIDGFGTGWMATGLGDEAWVRKIAAPAPTPEPEKPTYASVSPVPELLETNFSFEEKYHTAEGITSIDGQDFVFVADLIEFKRSSPALQYGMEGARHVKGPYQEGDRAIAAWLVKARNGLWYYLLTGGDDEWVRVRYVDTVRISDAPLLGDDMH